MYMDIGGKIKEFRVKSEMTQEELADRCGCVCCKAVSGGQHYKAGRPDKIEGFP